MYKFIINLLYFSVKRMNLLYLLLTGINKYGNIAQETIHCIAMTLMHFSGGAFYGNFFVISDSRYLSADPHLFTGC